jgi:hypothetical protein
VQGLRAALREESSKKRRAGSRPKRRASSPQRSTPGAEVRTPAVGAGRIRRPTEPRQAELKGKAEWLKSGTTQVSSAT